MPLLVGYLTQYNFAVSYTRCGTYQFNVLDFSELEEGKG